MMSQSTRSIDSIRMGRAYPIAKRRNALLRLECLGGCPAMLRVGAPALDREAAMVLVRELRSLEQQIRRRGMGCSTFAKTLGQRGGNALV